MKMFGLIPKPLRKIFKEVTHYACNSPPKTVSAGIYLQTEGVKW